LGYRKIVIKSIRILAERTEPLVFDMLPHGRQLK